jgi:protein TonB
VAPTAAPANTSTTTAVAAPAVAAPAAAITGAAPVARATAAPPVPTPGASAAPAIVSESTLTRVKFVTPSYPKEALADGTAGWVELEFTVTAEGKVTDVNVTASEPRHVFDSAASYALEHSRYQPVLREGVPVAQRAHLRERFQP